MTVQVGRWDCPVCGTQKIYGPKTRCPNCDSPRPENVQFYLTDDAEIITDKAQLKEARAGVDWICGHCRSQNKARERLCHACGNPKDNLSEDVDLTVKEYGLDEIPDSGTRPEDVAGETYRQARTRPGYKRKQPKGLLAKILSVPILAATLFLLLRSFPATIEVEVINHRWERSIQFEHYETVSKEAWEVPASATDVESFRAVHHYDKVFVRTETRRVKVKVGEESYVCGKRDLGNGYFEDKYCSRPVYEYRNEPYDVYKDVPVYGTKYRFNVMEWVASPSYLKPLAEDNQSPRWPGIPGTDTQNWKEGRRTSTYYLLVREDDGDEHLEKVSEAWFTRYPKGTTLSANRSRLLDIWYGLDQEQN